MPPLYYTVALDRNELVSSKYEMLPRMLMVTTGGDRGRIAMKKADKKKETRVSKNARKYAFIRRVNSLQHIKIK